MVKDKEKMLESGFTRDQTYYALKKARMGYHLSNKENHLEGKKYYAWIIHRLERELGIPTTPFREVKMLALEFYGKNPELFKQDEVEGEKVLKVMIERDYTPDKAYQNEEDKVKEEKLTEIFLYISF